MEKLERIPIRVPDLDGFIEGGIPKARNYLISGGPGTGKTIFCVQSLYEAAKQDEPVFYVTLEQRPDELRTGMFSSFGWDIEAYEKKGLFTFIDAAAAMSGVPSGEKEQIILRVDVEKLIKKVIDVSRRTGAKLGCIDSLNWLTAYIEKEAELRQALLRMNTVLKKEGITMLEVSEAYDLGGISKGSVEPFVVDGIFVMYYQRAELEATPREFFIRKLRDTKHHEGYLNLEIIKGQGIRITKPR